MLRATMSLVFRGHAGCPGVARALHELQGEYETAVAGEPDRDPYEWERSLRGAVEKAAGEPVADWEACAVVIAEQSKELVFDVANPAAKRRRGLADRAYTRNQLANLPKPEPLIENTLDRRTVALLAGYHGTCKSFVALDWAASVAT